MEYPAVRYSTLGIHASINNRGVMTIFLLLEVLKKGKTYTL